MRVPHAICSKGVQGIDCGFGCPSLFRRAVRYASVLLSLAGSFAWQWFVTGIGKALAEHRFFDVDAGLWLVFPQSRQRSLDREPSAT